MALKMFHIDLSHFFDRGIVYNEYQGQTLHIFAYTCQGTLKLTTKIERKEKCTLYFTEMDAQ